MIDEAFNLKQHISEPTHKSGHTLDLIITRADEDVARNFKLYDPVISDHLAVGCTLSIPKKAFEKKEVSYRKIKSVDVGQLREDIKNSCLVDPVSVGGDLDALTRKYNTVLSELLDKHAPLKKRTITLRPAAPWYNNTIRYARTICSKERSSICRQVTFLPAIIQNQILWVQGFFG